ncbi:MAG: class I SAM-dependent methyltransferase [Leptolyngbyaceae cyanobacterium T60_A2020_046]|nr:class I SAM-dependent methyltransferase [Leptolyngbyaceae cyanobacterium T60_A2020_046]
MRPDIAYIPTPEDAVEAMLDLAQVGPRDVLYDLGCGDGRLLIRAAQRWGTRGVGIDIDPNRIAQATAAAAAAGVCDRLQFRQGNLYDTSFHDATVVALYLLPHLNLRLRPRLWAELSPGCRVVSHQFDMGDWPPTQVLKLEPSEEESTLYLWVIGKSSGEDTGDRGVSSQRGMPDLEDFSEKLLKPSYQPYNFD